MGNVKIETHFTVILKEILGSIPDTHYLNYGGYDYVLWENKKGFFSGIERILDLECNKIIIIKAYSKKYWCKTKKVIDKIKEKLPGYDIQVMQYFVFDDNDKDYLGENQEVK